MAKAHVNGLAGAGAQDNELSGTLEAFADALAAAPHASALRYLSLSGNRFEGGAPAGLSRIAAFKPGPWRAPRRAQLTFDQAIEACQRRSWLPALWGAWLPLADVRATRALPVLRRLRRRLCCCEAGGGCRGRAGR